MELMPVELALMLTFYERLKNKILQKEKKSDLAVDLSIPSDPACHRYLFQAPNPFWLEDLVMLFADLKVVALVHAVHLLRALIEI